MLQFLITTAFKTVDFNHFLKSHFLLVKTISVFAVFQAVRHQPAAEAASLTLAELTATATSPAPLSVYEILK